MKLNTTQIEILTDRPDECIVECLAESWPEDQIDIAIASVRKTISTGTRL